MGAKITFDAVNRKFVVTIPPNPQGIIEIDLQVDLYSDAVEDWKNPSFPLLAGMNFPIDAIGGNQFGSDTLGISYLIKYGWSFKPYEADHTMRIVGNVGTESGWELVDDTIGAYRVRVENEVSSIVSLENLSFLEAGSYGGAIVVNDVSGVPGTDYPIGTFGIPSNNWTDAILIAEARGLGRFVVTSSMTLDVTADVDGYIIEGASPVTVTLTIDPSANVENCEFRNATIQGTLDGNNLFNGCHVKDVGFFNGAFHGCALEGTVTLGGGLEATLVDCFSGIGGGGVGQTPIIDMGGSGQALIVRNYHGGLKVTNCSGVGDSSLDISSGRVIFDATISAGNFWVRGIADVTDNSTGTTTVFDQTISSDTSRARKILTNRQEMVDTGGDVRIRTWDDDGVTVLEENIVTDPNDNDPALDPGASTKRGVSQ